MNSRFLSGFYGGSFNRGSAFNYICHCFMAFVRWEVLCLVF